MEIEVVKPGLFTSVQDQGREGYYHVGIPPSGGLDQFSATAGNLLVGNPESAAVLECTYMGPELLFTKDAMVAVTGAAMEPRVDGEPRPLWTVFDVGCGQVLSFGVIGRGARSYVAVAGGLEVPSVLGSRSTYALGGLGGHEGRILKAGDTLRTGAAATSAKIREGRAVSPALRPSLASTLELRVVMGLYDHLLTADGRRSFLDTAWTLTPLADRVGMRFSGVRLDFATRTPPFGAGSDPSNIVDAPYPIGAVQIPGGVEPIVLHRDAVSAGGYASVATVVSADMDVLAQAPPGSVTRFVAVDLDAALAARQQRNNRLARLRAELG